MISDSPQCVFISNHKIKVNHFVGKCWKFIAEAEFEDLLFFWGEIESVVLFSSLFVQKLFLVNIWESDVYIIFTSSNNLNTQQNLREKN